MPAAPAAPARPAATPPPGAANPLAGSPNGNIDGSVTVGTAMQLTITSGPFSVGTAVPGDSPETIGAVTMDVLTNNATGYNVTVTPANDDMTVGNTGTGTGIPVTDLEVREDLTGTAGTYAPLTLSTGLGTLVYNQTTPSAASPGDGLINDYRFGPTTPIPNVPAAIYSVTLDYVAATNAP